MEQFKPVKYYKWQYEASSLWYIVSLKNWEKNILKSRWVGKKLWYQQVMLYRKWKTRQKYVHRLVAQAFIPNPEKKSEVNHKDWNKLNNNIENLERMTHDENIEHARVNWFYEWARKWKFWKNNPASKAIIQLNKRWWYICDYVSMREASKNTWVPLYNISKCCRWITKIAWWYLWRYKTIE